MKKTAVNTNYCRFSLIIIEISTFLKERAGKIFALPR